MANLQGRCRCGDVRFAISGEPHGGIACHCRDCQYMAGGSANLSWIFDAEALTIEAGDPQCYRAKPESGGTFFCARCGVQLFSRPDTRPDLVAVKVGAMDDRDDFAVNADLWMASAPRWHRPHPGAEQFTGNMTAQETGG